MFDNLSNLPPMTIRKWPQKRAEIVCRLNNFPVLGSPRFTAASWSCHNKSFESIQTSNARPCFPLTKKEQSWSLGLLGLVGSTMLPLVPSNPRLHRAFYNKF